MTGEPVWVNTTDLCYSRAKPNARTFTLYVLDEPTVGLHMADVEKLIRVLHQLINAGHSVVVIEDNLDVIAEADWCIDMGPEAAMPGAGCWLRGCRGAGEGVEAVGDGEGVEDIFGVAEASNAFAIQDK